MWITALSLLFVTAQDGPSAAWNRFRGPNGTGIARDGTYPTEIGPERNVLWATPIPPGHSSPVLSRERVFLTGLEDEALVVFALERADGEPAWQREVPRPRRTTFHPDNHSAAASVAVDDDTVVAFFDEFGLAAFDHDGKERWRLPLGPFDNIYGMGASPVIVGDVVVQACDQQTGSYVLGVAKSDGRELWRVPRPQAVSGHCTPVVNTVSGVDEVLLPGSYLLDAYDAKSGARLWWLAGLPSEMKSVPVLLDGRLWLHGYSMPFNDLGNQIELPTFDAAREGDDADHDGRIAKSEFSDQRLARFFEFFDLNTDGSLDEPEWDALRISLASVNAAMALPVAGGKGEREASSVLWRYHRAIPQLPSPLVYGDAYWMVADQGGLLALLDPATGELLAKERLPDAVDTYYAAPVAGDGKVYILSKDGILSVLRAGRSFEPLHRAHFEETCYATPALEDDRIWLRTATKLYCFGEGASAPR